MAYIDPEKDIDYSEFTSDILFRKEFALLNTDKSSKTYNPHWDVSRFLGDPYLSLTSYQMFTANFMNPNTPYSRLLMKWGTGSGKTIGSLAIAMKYISLLKQTEPTLGYVFILGFTENIFKSELMRFPQFGFISYEELDLLNKLQVESRNNRSAGERLKELVMRVRRRFSNGKNNGFFQFLGYKQLAMHLFIPGKENIKISDLSREEIVERINDGRIKLNESLLKEFSNSLIICDEIHNLYNSLEKNNWGVAIETILNYNTTTRAVLLSATPINNSPTEIVDILNLLLPRTKYPVVRQEDLFDGDKLKPTADKKLREYFTGRVSFLQDVNPETFPSREFMGQSIPGIPFLKFVRTPMSEFHNAIYQKEVSDTLPQEGQYIMDFILPDPEIKYGKQLCPKPGIFKTKEIQNKYESASSEWRSSVGIGLVDDVITGPALHVDGHLAEISAKYHAMVKQIQHIIENGKGKIFIYHNYIHMSGVLFIQEVLRMNNFIMVDDPVQDSTICLHCGQPKSKHPKLGGGNEDIIRIVPRNEFVFDCEENNVLLFSYFSFEVVNIEVCVIPWTAQNVEPERILATYKKLNPKQTWVLQIQKSEINDSQITTRWEDPVNSEMEFVSTGPVNPTDVYSAMHSMETMLLKNSKKNQSAMFGGSVSSKTDSHPFRAVRFFVVHSNLDRKKIQHAVERFSSPANTFGEEALIIVGSRVLKESYTLKSVRNIFIMARPDNISMLVQIMGRAVRKDAHERLPPDQRKVEISLFTHCLPKNALSHEEQKYKLKMQLNDEIQKINRIMHECSIDRFFNHAKIFRDPELKKTGDLDILPYEQGSVKKRPLETSTFNAFHKETELNMVQYIIKRLFLEYSPVWKYAHLIAGVRSPPFAIPMDTAIFEDYIIHTALTTLVHFNDEFSFEPVLELTTRLTEKLYNINEKVLINAHGDTSVIIHVDDMYMLVPISNDKLLLYQEAPYRPRIKHKTYQWDLQTYIKARADASFESKRTKFIEKWKNVAILNMEPILYEFRPKFHQKLAEECIEYIQSLTNGRRQELHVFYFKLLDYYSLKGLILWADRVHENILEKYLTLLQKPKQRTLEEDIALELKTTDPNWISTGAEQGLNKKLNWIDKFLSSKDSKKTMIPAEYFPVGHFFDDVPRFYHPESKWYYDGQYVLPPSSYVENEIIIGFDERSSTTLSHKFKLRPPFKEKKVTDARLIEKGSVCMFKSKEQLQKIMKSLKIEHKEELISEMCQRIRNRLISLERQERNRGSKIKWYYYFYEKRPESVMN